MIGLGMQVDRIGRRLDEVLLQRENLVKAINECLPDLQHYADSHGPGPDVRLAALKAVLNEIRAEKEPKKDAATIAREKKAQKLTQ